MANARVLTVVPPVQPPAIGSEIIWSWRRSVLIASAQDVLLTRLLLLDLPCPGKATDAMTRALGWRA